MCFHAQQCIEKYLKAVLLRENLPIRKIHDLVLLLQECLPKHPLWEAMRPDLERLSQNAVLMRYPGETATREKARRAVKMMQHCREEIRAGLGLSESPRPKRHQNG